MESGRVVYELEASLRARSRGIMDTSPERTTKGGGEQGLDEAGESN